MTLIGMQQMFWTLGSVQLTRQFHKQTDLNDFNGTDQIRFKPNSTLDSYGQIYINSNWPKYAQFKQHTSEFNQQSQVIKLNNLNLFGLIN